MYSMIYYTVRRPKSSKKDCNKHVHKCKSKLRLLAFTIASVTKHEKTEFIMCTKHTHSHSPYFYIHVCWTCSVRLNNYYPQKKNLYWQLVSPKGKTFMCISPIFSWSVNFVVIQATYYFPSTCYIYLWALYCYFTLTARPQCLAAVRIRNLYLSV